jgi:hypothetical protein
MAPARIPIKANTSVLSTKVAFPRFDMTFPFYYYYDVPRIFYLDRSAQPKRIVGDGLNPVE